MNLFLDENEINRKTEEVFAIMNMELAPCAKVADLTVAKQQMVKIAKALSFNSEVLIMDEPTAALTDTEIEELFHITRGLRDKGVGIVHISHRLEELARISNRVTVMRGGICSACQVGRPNCCQFNQTLGVQRDGAMSPKFAVH